MKKIVVFPSLTITPHLETDLEQAILHATSGWKVIIVQCQMGLNTCLTNPSHFVSDCKLCISRTQRMCRNVLSNFPNVTTEYFRSQKKKIESTFNNQRFACTQDLRELSYRSYNVGEGVFSTIAYNLGEHDFDTSLYENLIFEEIQTSVMFIEWIENKFCEIRPDKVVIFNGRFNIQRLTVQYCKKNNIEFITHERAGVIGKYKIRENTYIHDIDVTKKEIVDLWNKSNYPDIVKFKIAKQFYEERLKGIPQGGFSFTIYQRENHLPDLFDKSKKNIVFFVSTWEEHESFKTWYGNKLYGNDLNAFKIILSDKKMENFTFWIRMHPNLRNKGRLQLSQTRDVVDKFFNVKVIRPESPIDSYFLALSCDKVIVFNSTMGAEASYLGKPVMNIGRSIYEELGISFIPSNHSEVVEWICDEIHSVKKKRVGHYQFGYWMKEHGTRYMFFKPGLTKSYFLGSVLRNTRLDSLVGWFHSIKNRELKGRLCERKKRYRMNYKQISLLRKIESRLLTVILKYVFDCDKVT